MNDFKLDDEPKIASGFKTPESYFDSFPQLLTQRLRNEESKIITLHPRRKTWLYIAAACVVISLTIPILNKISTTSDVDAIAAENYLASQVGISEELVYLLDENDIQNLKFEMNFEDQAVEDILSTHPDFEQYIIN